MNTLTWHWDRLEALAPAALYEALSLRARVFIIEQRCAYLDVDGLDHVAWHLRGCGRDGATLAYLRVLDPGRRFTEPSIGRVVVDPSVRGRGQGRVLMHEGIARCEAAWPRRAIRISAQARLQPFYASLGFVAAGDLYLEDDIEHVEMLRAGGERDAHR